MKQFSAEILNEYGPFHGAEQIHGVTFDGQRVWFASGDKLNAIDPDSGKPVDSLSVPAQAGTAFDGHHIFQIADSQIQKVDPKTGEVLGTIPAPDGCSGLAWAEGSLWVGQYQACKIHQLDPQTGKVLKSIAMPSGVGISGLGADGRSRFFCGGGQSGKLRVVRCPD